ncbi:hypothetical protein [Mucilaginibacter sp.]|uniref:hypothetical protein n=1 Tax=Mucilaginibacter sp. TaxID=1882438 RepID=UPI0025FFDADC|nr:hypothetical protein [Mucilaginibacter sp.]
MTKATKAQIIKINVMLQNIGVCEKSEKAKIVSAYSGGRTTSAKELYIDEARDLIGKLANYDPLEKQKRLIFSLGYKAGIIYGDTAEDKKLNPVKLNLFIKERGAVKKPLNEMTLDELKKVHRQFEGIVRNNKKTKLNKEADKAVNELLNELKLQTV